MDAAEPDFGGIPRAIKNVETAKIEDVSEIVELNDLSKLDGFAEMLATIDKEDPQYNSVRKMAISEAEMVGEKYQISPVDLVGYIDTKTDMFSEKMIDDGKKEVLMENIKNTSFGFANGGIMNNRMGYNEGGSVITLMDGTTVQIPDGAYDNGTFKDIIYSSSKGDILREEIIRELNFANGGSVLPAGMEMDYRGGGFIPMGSKERADDVDARVSKNEFVMTADAVRAAGGGSVNQGAKRMYELMNNLEARA